MATYLPAITSTASVAQTYSAQSTMEQQAKLKSELEDVAAMQRETDRKLELARAIGAIRAGAGAAGIGTQTGSPLTVIQESIRQSEEDQSRDEFNTLMRKQSEAFRIKMRAGEMWADRALSLVSLTGESFAGVKKDKSGTVK